eukprot:2193888-Lingulodinium_polyedra.AAC.1
MRQPAIDAIIARKGVWTEEPTPTAVSPPSTGASASAAAAAADVPEPANASSWADDTWGGQQGSQSGWSWNQSWG